MIAVCGEVDMSTAHLITELSEDAIDARPARLVLDLAGVTFFSAHGISALLQTQRAAAHAHVQLPLRDAAPCITYLLALTGTPMSLDETAATSILTSDAVHRTGDLSPCPRLPTADGRRTRHSG
ncbi:STAS domain-containing protein [Micromonospora palomenae]|uniref:STAS domain-containing protein n=1 Tax=Micromonospora palomenae TaxID=1461247 RepID=UPI003F8BD376